MEQSASRKRKGDLYMYISRKAKKRLNVLLFVILFAIIILTSDVEAYRKLWDDSKETFFNIINVKEDFDVDEIQTVSDETLQEAELIRVVDGDTIIVSTAKESKISVRLIGIDTPESVNPDQSKNSEYGELASTYTKELLQDTSTVYLQYDEQTTDKYGRTLAYVWLAGNVDVTNQDDIDNYMLNALIVKNGYAYDKVYEPNHTYAEIFKTLRTEAQKESTGLWAYADCRNLW